MLRYPILLAAKGMVVVSLLLLAVGAPAFAASGAEHIRILSTNDMHNYLRPLYYRYIDDIKPWGQQSSEGDYVAKARLAGKVGGMAHVATVIKRLRREGPENTLLLDAGDTWHGAGISLLDQGGTMVDVMNEIGYDFMVPGNWDFFYSKKRFFELIEKAKFSVSAYNLTDREWEEPVLPEYEIKQVGNLKIAIIGMTYPWTALTTSAEGAAQWWRFGIKEDEAAELIKRIRAEESPDLVVLVSHGGFGMDQKFAQRVDGIDVLISGHTHDEVTDPVVWNDTIIFQGGAHGKYVASLDLEIKGKKVVNYDYQLVMVNPNQVPADKRVAKIVAAAYQPHEKMLNEVIGETRTLLYRRDFWQSPIGNLMTAAIRDISKADIAFFPAWRYGATLLPGKITVEDVLNIVPTGGNVVTYSMRGKEIKMLLENLLDSVVDPDPYARVGGDMIRFDGLTLRYDLALPSGRRVVSLKVGDQPLKLDAYYSIASVNTRFQNSPMFGALQVKDTGSLFSDELIAYIKRASPLGVTLDDRIRAVSND